MTTGKISISLPRSLLMRLERLRRSRGHSRSQAVAQAVDQWLRSLEGDREAASYVAGYARDPEDAAPREGLTGPWARGLEREDWS